MGGYAWPLHHEERGAASVASVGGFQALPTIAHARQPHLPWGSSERHWWRPTTHPSALQLPRTRW